MKQAQFAVSVCLLCGLAWTRPSVAMTIAEAANEPVGTLVTINEALVVTDFNMVLDNPGSGASKFYIKDDTRAAHVFLDPNDSYSTVEQMLNGSVTGDVVSFQAYTSSFQGEFGFVQPVSQATQVVSPTISMSLDPVGVSCSQFADYSATAESLEGRYVSLTDIQLFYVGEGLSLTWKPNDAYPSAAGVPFAYHTTYLAENAAGEKVTVWARSQAAVDILNDHYGMIPHGYFDLTGILVHAYDETNPTPGTPGKNYILNPVFVPEPISLSFLAIGSLVFLPQRRRACPRPH